MIFEKLIQIFPGNPGIMIGLSATGMNTTESATSSWKTQHIPNKFEYNLKFHYFCRTNFGPIVQGIERKFPKLQIQVRVLVGLPLKTVKALINKYIEAFYYLMLAYYWQ